MKVIYSGRTSRRINSLPDGDEDIIELFSNNWNDYGYETLFMTVCRANGKALELGPIRLLIDGESNTRQYLAKLLNEGWNGEFPIPDVHYISTPSEIAFYEQLDGAFDSYIPVKIAKILKDASYLVHVQEDAVAQEMVQTSGFKNSLQRERGSIEAYLDGWKVLDRSAISANNLSFSFKNFVGDVSEIEFRFSSSENIFPHDINVLIGANGVGKSQILHQLVDAWLAGNDETSEFGFSTSPNLSRLIVVSYSPFELFPVDLADKKLKDKNAYKYFGLRGRVPSKDGGKASRTILSRDVPKIDAANALIASATDDQRYHLIKGWGQKISTAESVLRSAIDFEHMAVEIELDVPLQNLFLDEVASSDYLMIGAKNEYRRYVPVNALNVLALDISKLNRSIRSESGVAFIKNGKFVELSSGQRLFTYLVINILGAIRRNCLILIDEPELFLHPTLEIQLVEMLKSILRNFNSRAILATHSLVTVREVPSDCVHVLEKSQHGLLITQPPFQTFGGDVQRISSYVFGDRSVSKPFENWIEAQLKKHDDSADELISVLGANINEEMIVQIKAMERGKW